MSQEVNVTLRATDEASRTVAAAGKNIKSSLQGVEQQGKMTFASMKNLAVGFSGVATSAFSLYNAYDRVQNAQLSVDRANLKVKQSANSVEDAQRRQNRTSENLEKAEKDLVAVIEEFGEESEEAAKAQAKLEDAVIDYDAAASDAKIATERYEVSVASAQQAQENLSSAMVQSALQIVPSCITIADSILKIKTASEAAAGAQGVAGLSGSLSALKGIGSVVVPVTVAIGVAWAITEGIKWVKENIIYPWAESEGVNLKEYEKRQAENPELFPGYHPKGLVPGMQHGGVVTSPTLAVIGEGGPEAVVPLDRFGGGSVVVKVVFEGDVYGVEDFDKRVRKAAGEGTMEALRRRG